MILCIDGVVGAGKTTLAEKISQTLNIPLFLELGDPATDKLLSLFYEDKKRWAFT
jgi:deoxyadenosine/deoxycytidine kinase